MKEKGIAIYPGTFDPITNGHLWMIKEGIRDYEKLIVVIGVNPEKHTTFSVEERMEMIVASAGELASQFTVDSFTNKFLVDYAESVGAKHIIRGVRNNIDKIYESDIAGINADINPEIETELMLSPTALCKVGSSIVKGMVGLDNWEEYVSRYVPEPVLQKLKEWNSDRHAK